jgi:hypothetical protein
VTIAPSAWRFGPSASKIAAPDSDGGGRAQEPRAHARPRWEPRCRHAVQDVGDGQGDGEPDVREEGPAVLAAVRGRDEEEARHGEDEHGDEKARSAGDGGGVPSLPEARQVPGDEVDGEGGGDEAEDCVAQDHGLVEGGHRARRQPEPLGGFCNAEQAEEARVGPQGEAQADDGAEEASLEW